MNDAEVENLRNPYPDFKIELFLYGALNVADIVILVVVPDVEVWRAGEYTQEQEGGDHTDGVPGGGRPGPEREADDQEPLCGKTED